jgi:hypothetical protein
MRNIKYLAVAAAIGAPLSLTLAPISSSGASGAAPVVVTNTSTQPVPVTGTVNVGNFPTSQTISGTVSVANFPATQPISGNVGILGTPTVNDSASTVLIAHGEATLPAGGGASSVGLPGSINTAAYKAIKAVFFCESLLSQTSRSDCSAAHLFTSTQDLVSGEGFAFDQYAFPANTFGLIRSYEEPGTSLDISGNNPGSKNLVVAYAIYGRSN